MLLIKPHIQSQIVQSHSKQPLCWLKRMEEKLLCLFSHQSSVHSPVNTVSVSTALCNTGFPSAEPFIAAVQFFVPIDQAC